MECRGSVLKPLTSKGDNMLGGQDLNYAMMDYCINEQFKDDAEEVRKNHSSMRKLFNQCEDAKKRLSDEDEVEIEVGKFFGEKSLSVILTKEKFEELCKEPFARVIACCEKARSSSGLEKSSFANIILAGGSSRIPAFFNLAKEYLGKEPDIKMHPDQAIAMGACLESWGRNQPVQGITDVKLPGVEKKPEPPVVVVHDILSRSIGVKLTKKDDEG